MNLNRSRESCPCIEKFDLEFKKWILINGRTRKNIFQSGRYRQISRGRLQRCYPVGRLITTVSTTLILMNAYLNIVSRVLSFLKLRNEIDLRCYAP